MDYFFRKCTNAPVRNNPRTHFTCTKEIRRKKLTRRKCTTKQEMLISTSDRAALDTNKRSPPAQEIDTNNHAAQEIDTNDRAARN